ncbi:Carotene biosynthesis-related CBR [Chlorella sorokiniana]|jgi:hypothetical protein|uniref:Carotene biosynthesis-related CBR n=1 Tax=Chlorella sorokiniana TaxID=3076 RepID=A0A2P6TNM2_CHLSO|nr:Carotene biosynthesis-related CBR [Chlorella sorokiniana]|eukprot:PRW50936.1 Carotene biosynthesis-related CBR [Chlorella sorokiniana]
MAAALATRAPLALRSSTAAPRSLSRRHLVVRASAEEKEQPSSGTVFFKGNNFTEEEWKKASAEGVKPAATPDYSLNESAANPQAMSFGQLMAFSGPAPELINGRLSMLAFVAALGAELASGEPVLRQLGEEPTGVFLAVITFAAASLIPMLNSAERKPFGPFTPAAEMLNGRAAMIGFAALLVVEAVRGTALF